MCHSTKLAVFLPMTWTRQIAHVSHSTSHDHIATAFHFFRENIFWIPCSLEGVLSSGFASTSIFWLTPAILSSQKALYYRAEITTWGGGEERRCGVAISIPLSVIPFPLLHGELWFGRVTFQTVIRFYLDERISEFEMTLSIFRYCTITSWTGWRQWRHCDSGLQLFLPAGRADKEKKKKKKQ